MSTVSKGAHALPPPLPRAASVVHAPGKPVADNTKIVLLLAAVAGALLFAIAVALVLKAGPGENAIGRQGSSGSQVASGAVTGSEGFRLEYELVDSNSFPPRVAVTVKGRAVKLAVIFIRPDKEPQIVIIDREDMITNSTTRILSLMSRGAGYNSPDAGTYALEVKTFDPERTVCKKEFTLSLDELTVTDVKLIFRGDTRQVHGANVSLHKKGNLPVTFNPVSATLNREHAFTAYGGATMTSQNYTVKTYWPSYYNRIELEEGERCLLEGQLFYNSGDRGDRKECLPFRKELVVP